MNVSRVLMRIGMMIVGILVALVALTVLMMIFPRPFVGATAYYDRNTANVSLEIHYRNIDGDLFVALPGRVRPPQEVISLAQFTLNWDADGFRLPARAADSYPIAIFGDSFTESVNVPLPYADGLAERLGVGVRNYGYRAYGPREVARAAAEVAADEPRRWLIYGYFSGNDLGDTVRPPKIDTASPVALWEAFVERLSGRVTTAPPMTLSDERQYDYPMPVIIGGNYYEIAFLPYYLWWQIAPPEGFEASANYRVVSDTLDSLAESVNADACKLVIFIPTKEQLYYRYIYPTERQWLRGVGSEMRLDPDDNTLYMESLPFDEAAEEAMMARFYGQRDMLAGLAAARGWRFLDLTPAFEAAVAAGELLYYPYDTHWNQAGHDLAAQTLADYIESQAGC